MKKIIIWLIAIVIILVAGFLASGKQEADLPQDFRDVTFSISGVPITLHDGVAQARTDLGGNRDTTVRYFGNKVTQDVDGDGAEDTVFLVTQETAAGNVFFFAVAALKRGDGYLGSKAVLLGDRIAPQTTGKGEGRMIVVNFATRAPGEPITARASMGKSMWLLFDAETMQFGEVVRDFEGEGQR
jgi:hypothetical protein